MSDSKSEYYDDADDYVNLCRKHEENIRPNWHNPNPYGVHATWLKLFDKGETLLSYKEYKRKDRIKDLQLSIELKEDRLSKLREELKSLLDKGSVMKYKTVKEIL